MRGLACALACVAASYAQTPVDMIGYWRFDDGSGNIASDSATAAKHVKNIDTDQYYLASSYGLYPGTITGATWGAGQIHLGLHFKGADKVVTPPIPIAGAFTISAWVNPTPEAVNTPYAYLRIAETAYDVGLYLGTDMSGTKYKLMLNSGAGSAGGCNDAFGCVSGGKPVANKWQLVTATYDGAYARLYVDGVQVAYDTAQGRANVTMPLSIGEYAYYPGAGYGWRGGIDDVRLYPRALSAGEVAALYNQAAGARLVPVLITAMKCKESAFLGRDTRTVTCAMKSNNEAWKGTVQLKLAPDPIALSDRVSVDSRVETEVPPFNYAWPVLMQRDGAYAVTAVALYDRAGVPPRKLMGVDFYGQASNAVWDSHAEGRAILVGPLDAPCPAAEPCESGLYPPPLAVTEMRCEIQSVDSATQSVTCGIAANQARYGGVLRVNNNDGTVDDQRVTVDQPTIENTLQYWGVTGVATGGQAISGVEFIADAPIANWTPEKTTPYPPAKQSTSVHGWLCRHFGWFCR